MDRSQLNAWQEMTLAIFLTDFFFLDAKDDISNMGKGDWSGVAKKNLPFLFLLSQIIEVMVHSDTQYKNTRKKGNANFVLLWMWEDSNLSTLLDQNETGSMS